MQTISFYSLENVLKSKVEIKRNAPYEEILSELDVRSPFIFFRNLLYSSHEQWNPLENNEEFREQICKSKAVGKGENIDLLVLSQKPTKNEELCSERLEAVIKTLKAYKIKYCVKEVIRTLNYVFQLFCMFNADYTNIDGLSNDQLYFLVLYSLCQLIISKQRVFLALRRKSDPNFEPHIDKLALLRTAKSAALRLCKNENRHFRGFAIMASLHKVGFINLAVAELYHLEAIKRGDMFNSLNILALYYRDTLKDHERIDALCRWGEKMGHLSLINMLAIYYAENKRGTKLVLSCFNTAIKRGSVYAIYAIGHYYYFLKEKNYDKMKDMYLEAIKYNIPNAMNDLAYYYQIVVKDYQSAEKYYKMAIEKHEYNYSIRNLGCFYRNIKKDYKEMKKYLMMGVERGCRYSAYTLAEYFRETDKNEDLMIKYYTIAHRLGHKDVYYTLGRYFQYEKINYNEMRKYYQNSIDQMKCTKSMIKLAVYYHDVENNKTKAMEYLNLAIKNGDHTGYHYLAIINEFEGNTEEMVKCYKIAIMGGSEASLHRLAEYYKSINHLHYFYYFLRSVDKGNIKSLESMLLYAFSNETKFICQMINPSRDFPILLNSKEEEMLLKRIGPIPQEITLQRLKKTLKLLHLMHKKFDDYNFRIFIILYHLCQKPRKSMVFLKRFVLVNRIDPNLFYEYKDFKQSEFQKELLSNQCYDLKFNYTR